MQAGILDTEITILKLSTTVSEYGDQTETYTDGATTRAHIEQIGGGRTDANNEVDYIYRKRIQVRRYVDVGDYDRIRLNGKVYRILDIADDRIINKKTLTIELVNNPENIIYTPQPTPGDNNTTNPIEQPIGDPIASDDPIEQPIDQPWGS